MGDHWLVSASSSEGPDETGSGMLEEPRTTSCWGEMPHCWEKQASWEVIPFFISPVLQSLPGVPLLTEPGKSEIFFAVSAPGSQNRI